MTLKVLREESYELGTAPDQRSVDELLRFGVVPIDKPLGPSSHEVSAFVKKILKVKKTGHSGTLDPEVSGVLPVLLENSCKLAGMMLGSIKEYVCVMKLGADVPQKDLEQVLENFRGKIYQTPPLESAVKKQLRIREIYGLKVLEKEGDLVLFDSRVQGGTYIRRLVRDIGVMLGSEAKMVDLRRTIAAGLKEELCITLQELSDRYWLWKEKGDEMPLRECVLPIEKAVKLKKVVVGDDVVKFLCNGADLAVSGINEIEDSIHQNESIGIFSGKGELVCLAKALMPASQIIENYGNEKLSEKGIAVDVERVVNDLGVMAVKKIA